MDVRKLSKSAFALALTAGLVLGAAQTATAGTDAGRLSDAELVAIAQSQNEDALSTLSDESLQRLVELSAEDPNRSTEEASFSLASVDGRTPSAAEIAEFDEAIGSASTLEEADSRIADLQGDSGSLLATAAAVCKNGSYSRVATNGLGNSLYKSFINVTYCQNSGTMTSTKISSTGGQTLWLGWSWEGTTNKGNRVISNVAKNFSQNHFRYAVFQVGVIQNVYPCIALDYKVNNNFADGSARCSA